MFHVTLCPVFCIHMSHYVLLYYYHTTSSTLHAGDALNLPAVLAGAVVVFLLLTLLIAGIIVGAVLLGRKAHNKETPPQRRVQNQQNSSITKGGRGTEEQKGKEVHIYDAASDDASIEGRAMLYQGLNMGTLDYVSEYTGARPQEQRGGAPLPEDPHQQGEGGIWKK